MLILFKFFFFLRLELGLGLDRLQTLGINNGLGGIFGKKK